MIWMTTGILQEWAEPISHLNIYDQWPVILLMEEILHRLIGSSSHYLQGFLHPRWCRISSIKSMMILGQEMTGSASFFVLSWLKTGKSPTGKVAKMTH